MGNNFRMVGDVTESKDDPMEGDVIVFEDGGGEEDDGDLGASSVGARQPEKTFLGLTKMIIWRPSFPSARRSGWIWVNSMMIFPRA